MVSEKGKHESLIYYWSLRHVDKRPNVGTVSSKDFFFFKCQHERGCEEVMDISNHMDKTNNFYIPSKLQHTGRKGHILRLGRDQVVMIKDILLHTAGNRFQTHYHLMVLEKDTK